MKQKKKSIKVGDLVTYNDIDRIHPDTAHGVVVHRCADGCYVAYTSGRNEMFERDVCHYCAMRFSPVGEESYAASLRPWWTAGVAVQIITTGRPI